MAKLAKLKFCLMVIALFALCIFSGCTGRPGQKEITNGYGKSSGQKYHNSVNGNAVFTQMFREGGSQIKKVTLISPRIEKFDTIVWFRDRFEAPDREAVDKLEEWLEGGYSRQLIIIGRDHDSGIDYWQAVVDRATGEDLIKARRRLAKVKSEFHRRRMGRDLTIDKCAWFNLTDDDYQTGAKLRGEWAASIDGSKVEVNAGIMMKPNSVRSAQWDAGNSQTVLFANDQPLVTITKRTGYNKSSVVLVSNASFVTNYGLVNSENRILARRLVNRQFAGKTLFVESGSDPVRVSESDDNHETWAWITKPPLKYMVPHFLLLGVFFCFVLYPIFGRPKRIETDDENTNFRTHVKAMGKLLARSGRPDHARDKIMKYNNRQ